MRLVQNLYLCRMKILTMIIILLVASSFNKQVHQNYNSKKAPDISLEIPGSLRDSIEGEIAKYNFQYPDIIIAQALLEAGSRFQSDVFRDNRNMFGMRKASSRLTNAKKTNRTYAVYEHWKESIIDRALYEASYLRGKNKEDYYAYLGRNYSSNKNYISELKKIVKGL